MTEDRALEIIAAYGADAMRWPDAERAPLLALAAQPGIAAALAEARALDALLGDWARADVAALPFDAGRLAPVRPVAAPVRLPVRRRWLAATAVAAAVAAVIALVPIGPMTPRAVAPQIALNATPSRSRSVSSTLSAPSSVPSVTASGEAGSDAGFAYVFTPTVDEDALI